MAQAIRRGRRAAPPPAPTLTVDPVVQPSPPEPSPPEQQTVQSGTQFQHPQSATNFAAEVTARMPDILLSKIMQLHMQLLQESAANAALIALVNQRDYTIASLNKRLEDEGI